jgi:D-alanyl-D-alanine carboxypeptidase/D-alanyl-D-alanine-endopeptidase (penicillin-binding protein 4)
VPHPRLRVAGLIALITLGAAGAGVGGYFGTDAVRAEPSPSTPAPTPSAYLAAGASPTPASTRTTGAPAAPAAVAAALRPLLASSGLGPQVRAEVVDAAGGVLYSRDATATTAPASTAKILTAAAALAVRSPGYRIRTTVRSGSGGAVVLVGAGDPTLTGAAAGHDGAYRDAARISDLAAQLRRAHVTPTRIVVDGSLFSGPAVSPKWAAEDIPSDYAAPITAAMVDGGRNAPSDYIRSTTPDLAAGRRLAAALGRPDLPVVRGAAPAGARELAAVESAPLGTLIEQMLHVSDNVIAECLARQVALAEHQPASFTGATAAVRTVLTRLGVDPGAGLVDGSGLAASDRTTAAALVGVLRLAATADRSGLGGLLAALPVAGWSGTLADRYLKAASRPGAGLVRAKTGTLTGVSALAGTVHDRDGRLLLFAFVADRAPGTAVAEASLDALAARLAQCGCS